MNQIDLNNLSRENTKLLNDIYDDLINDYHKSIDSIYNIVNKKSIYLYLCTTLSRNHNLSNLFINLCYLELVKILVNKDNIKFVKCRSFEQKIVIKQYFKNLNKSINVEYKEILKDKLKRYIAPILDFLRNIKISLRELFHRNKDRKLDYNKENEIIIIDTFLIKSMFKNGVYHDRYYSGLLQNIDNNTKKKIYFCPTILINNDLNKYIDIVNKKENFIFKFDYLKISDYLFALFIPFLNNSFFKKKIFFKEFNISKIVKREYHINRFHSSTFQGILNFLFFKRLKENNIKVILAVDWFENQPIDKGFNLGLNKYFSKSETIGYQGFILCYKYNLHLVPISKEVEAGLIPKKICVIGKGLVPFIKKYYSKLNVKTAPAFRFSYLYNDQLLSKTEDANYKILVALPLSYTHSYNIITQIIKVSDSINLNYISWFIKPHPSLDISRLKNNINHWPINFELTKDTFSKSLINSNIMIGGSSSTCMEALAYGIPVIIIADYSSILQNPIPNNVSKNMWSICFSEKDCLNALYSFYKRKHLSKNKFRNEILKAYFNPISTESMDSILPLK